MRIMRLAAFAIYLTVVVVLGIAGTRVYASSPLVSGVSLSVNSAVNDGLAYESIEGRVWFKNSSGIFGLPGVGINQPGMGIELIYGPWGSPANTVIDDCNYSNPSDGNGNFHCEWYSVFQITPPGAYNLTAVFRDSSAEYNPSETTQEFKVDSIPGNGLSLVIQGLPSGVQTTLQLGQRTSQVGSGRYSYIKPNSTQTVSVSQQINSASGDTQYRCQNFSQSIESSTPSVVFTYATWYQFKVIGGDLPANLNESSLVKLVLKVNGTDSSPENFSYTQGSSNFYPQETIVKFKITPTYIHSTELDYNFTGWNDAATNQAMNLPASTTGLYEVIMTKPYSVKSCYSEWVEFRIESNLPGNMTTSIQISDPNGVVRNVSVPGSVVYSPFPRGILPLGSTIQYEVKQNQIVFFSEDGSTQYELQDVTPSSPITLKQHTTITINYVTKYRVLVVSQFENAVIEPRGGVGWFTAGDNATLQVSMDANDMYGVPYVFDGWDGLPEASNQITVHLIVNGPLHVSARWKPNWTEILIFAGATSGISAAAFLFGRRKLRAWKRSGENKKKLVQAANQQPDNSPKRHPEKIVDKDQELYNYIIEKGGALHLPDAMKQLQMSREEINDSIKRLKQTKLFHERKPQS